MSDKPQRYNFEALYDTDGKAILYRKRESEGLYIKYSERLTPQEQAVIDKGKKYRQIYLGIDDENASYEEYQSLTYARIAFFDAVKALQESKE